MEAQVIEGGEGLEWRIRLSCYAGSVSQVTEAISSHRYLTILEFLYRCKFLLQKDKFLELLCVHYVHCFSEQPA
jgi:hypothetical protein